MASEVGVRTFLLLVVLLGIGMGRILTERGSAPPLHANFESIPLNFGETRGIENQIDARTLDVLQATQTLNRKYLQGEDKYWLFVGYFARQRFGSQIHSPRHCYPGSGWDIVSSRRSDQMGDSFGELLIQRDHEKRIVLYQYMTRNGSTTNEYRLKLEMIKNALFGRPQDAVFVRFSTSIGALENEVDAIDRLGDLVEQLMPSIRSAAPF